MIKPLFQQPCFHAVTVFLTHPIATAAGLFVSLGSVAALLQTAQATAVQIALAPFASAEIVNVATHAETSLAIAVAVGTGLAAIGRGLLVIEGGGTVTATPPPVHSGS